MLDVLPLPKVFKNDQNIQLSHETPHRIHDAVWYPRPSTNGSAIIIYGHENGIRIIWRGGRPFKTPATTDDKLKTNGAKSEIVMVIDSDDEPSGLQGPPFVDKPEFEDDDEEFDTTKPLSTIVQHLDLNFGAGALHIAVPAVYKASSDTAFDHGPSFSNDQLIFAAACSDRKIRLITMPLTPPSPASKLRQDIRSSITAGNAGNGKWGETMLELGGSQLPPDGISITFSRAKADISSTTGVVTEDAARFGAESRNRGSEWHILVASHSRDGPGLLLIHRIPIKSVRKEGRIVYSLSRDSTAAFQRVSLSSPARKISFNPHISSPLHSTHLLVADRSGSCRIYDCEPLHASASASSDNSNSAALLQSGSWLLTMYPGFHNSKSDPNNLTSGISAGLGRKSIVDAKWVLGGKAVVVLLSDGEWGIWDIEGTGAGGGSKGILGRQGIRGGAITAFSLSGWIDSTPTKLTSSKGSTSQLVGSKFAPMTPGTRKTTEPTLFNSRSGQGFVEGQISVSRLPITSTTSLVEESVAFWLEESYFVIPNLRAYWEAQSRKSGGGVGGSGGLFAGGSPTSRLIRLEGITLRGERCCGIAQHPREASSRAQLPTEILIVGEHRYLIVSDRTKKSHGSQRRNNSQGDYQITAPRDLDVMEIDQVLSQMENSHFNSQPNRKSGLVP